MRGKLITFEGCEGVGKSTQIKWAKEFLDKNSIPNVLTREPGGSVVAEKIRSIILDKDNVGMSDICEAFLYASARAQHIADIIKPNIKAGKIVICDRYIDSTFAYQGEARGLGSEFVEKLNSLAIGEFVPDITIFLDLPPAKAFCRKGGADKQDRLELMDIGFHEKVYEGYKLLAKKYPNRIVTIDASGDKWQTNRKIIKVLSGYLNIN